MSTAVLHPASGLTTDSFELAAKSQRDGRMWRAVRTRSRHEWKVRDQLVAKQIDTFCPTTYRWNHYRQRAKRTEWPLFPGYCFVRIAADATLPVLTCFGVTQIVSFAGYPAEIPEHEIEAIQRLTSSALEYDALPFVKIGAPVQVIRGPLSGTRGRLLRKGANFRLLLSIELLGRMLSVEVSAADVKPV